MLYRDSFALDFVDARDGNVEQQIDEVVLEQIREQEVRPLRVKDKALDAADPALSDNRFEGFAREVLDLRHAPG